MAESALIWHKSSFCDTGACLEAAPADTHVVVRNNTRPQEKHLRLEAAQWHGFLDAVAAGEFRDL